MATALNTSAHPLRSRLLWGIVLPVHFHLHADIGHAYYFEQRYWLDHLRIANSTDYRKRERKGRYLENCARAWGLHSSSFCLPAKEAGAFKPVMLSSAMVLAWLFMQYRHYEAAHDGEKLQSCQSAIDAWFLMAVRGFAKVDGEPISLTVLGAVLQVAACGRIDIGPLFQLYPLLAEEWDTLRSRALVGSLAQLLNDRRPLISDFLRFLEARLHYSEEPAAWMVDLRSSVLMAITFAMELEIFSVLDAESVAPSNIRIHQLFGRSGMRKARRSAATKMQALQKASAQCGSKNTIMDTLTDSKGYAAITRNVSNQLYERMAAQTLSDSCALSMSWDGATYGGLSVNIAMALDCDSLRCCHLKPGVPIVLSHI